MKFCTFVRRKPRHLATLLEHDHNHLTVTRTFNAGDNLVWTTNWDQVCVIATYKQDLIIYDMIYMLVQTHTHYVEFNEEAIGWASLLQMLPSYLDGVRDVTGLIYVRSVPLLALGDTPM